MRVCSVRTHPAGLDRIQQVPAGDGHRAGDGLSASRPVGFSKWTVMIGRTGLDTMSSIPEPTLSLTSVS